MANNLSGNELVTSVNINGENIDLGGEMTSNEAINQLQNLDLMGSVQGASATVTNGCLSFVYARGDKGIN